MDEESRGWRGGGAADKVRSLLDAGDPKAAIELIETSDEGHDDPDLLSLWGEALLADGKAEQARWKFEEALELDDERPEPYLGAARALLRQDRLEEAAARLADAAGCDAFDRALITIRDLVRDNASSFRAYVVFAQRLNSREMYHEASRVGAESMSLVDALSGIPPRDIAEARRTAASTAIDLKQYGRARDLLEPSISQASRPETNLAAIDAARDHLFFALAAAGAHQLDSALDHFEEAAVFFPDAEVVAARGIAGVYAELGDYSRAHASLGRIVDILDERERSGPVEPAYDSILFAEALSLQGDFVRAAELGQEITSANRDDARAWGLLTVIHREHSEFLAGTESSQALARAREAAYEAERALTLTMQENRSVSRLVGAAFIAASIGEHEKALGYLTEAQARDHSDAQAHFLRGLIGARDGDLRQALKSFIRAQTLDPHDWLHGAYLGGAYLRLGSPDKAEERFRDILMRAPGHIDARIGLGEALTALGDRGEAAAFEDALDEFTEVLRLDDTMKLEPARREASSSLSPRRKARVYYGRGYARVGSYDAKSARGASLRRRDLTSAEKDFKRCLECDPAHAGAKRAIQKITPLKSASSGSRISRIAPFLVSALSLGVMAVAALNFLIAWPEERLLDSKYWILATFGALGFLLGGLTLPELLKLKVGAVQLEKQSAVEPLLQVGLQGGILGAVTDMSLPTILLPGDIEKSAARARRRQMQAMASLLTDSAPAARVGATKIRGRASDSP